MPHFYLHLRRRRSVEPDELGLHSRDLHHAYMNACKAIPDLAREELIAGRDPMVCAFLICDAAGRQLMEVLFSEVLAPSEWALRQAPRRPYDQPRSAQTRDDLALSMFRRMFSALDVGCVLMTPELRVVEMNLFGAQHSHVDPEQIRGMSILNTFSLSGDPRINFTKFMIAAQRGMVSSIVDMPYLVLNGRGETVDGWWNARTWPIFDDDNHILGLVEWAEPNVNPTNGGKTLRRTAAQ